MIFAISNDCPKDQILDIFIYLGFLYRSFFFLVVLNVPIFKLKNNIE